jgi:hypothetical protein
VEAVLLEIRLLPVMRMALLVVQVVEAEAEVILMLAALAAQEHLGKAITVALEVQMV